jgi:hypothetical protein
MDDIVAHYSSLICQFRLLEMFCDNVYTSIVPRLNTMNKISPANHLQRLLRHSVMVFDNLCTVIIQHVDTTNILTCGQGLLNVEQYQELFVYNHCILIVAHSQECDYSLDVGLLHLKLQRHLIHLGWNLPLDRFVWTFNLELSSL